MVLTAKNKRQICQKGFLAAAAARIKALGLMKIKM